MNSFKKFLEEIENEREIKEVKRSIYHKLHTLIEMKEIDVTKAVNIMKMIE